MNTNHVVLLLDRSGSMASYVPVTIKGVNEVLATAKNVHKETGANIKISMFGFENEAELIKGFDAVPVQDLKPVTTKEVFGSGGTQMYDGISFTLMSMEQKFEEGDTMLVAIFTDGDTAGDKVPVSLMKQVIKHKQGQGVTFALLKPKSHYAHRNGADIGIPDTNVMEYEHSQNGFRSAFYKLSRGLRKYLTKTIGNEVFSTSGFFDNVEPQNAMMKANGLEVTMNMPESLRSEDETASGELPGYAPVETYVVDEYPACPTNWMNGSAKAASYFVPVKTNHGMWLDFNKLQEDENDIAVVVSVQGVNPITGQKTSSLRLEKYENKCPIHDKDFAQERFCKDCGFKWPAQNYISTNAAPNGQFWLDGFRSADGKVRQYVFTEEQARGVANAIVGSDRVFAIGVAFFKSKNKKPKPQVLMGGGFEAYGSSPLRGLTNLRARGQNVNSVASYKSVTKGGPRGQSMSCNVRGMSNGLSFDVSQNDPGTMGGGGGGAASADADFLEATVPCSFSPPDILDGSVDTTMYQLGPQTADMFAGVVAPVQTKSYEVAAGANIDQQVHADANKMEYWQEEPFSMLYINYADEESVKKILAAGKRKEVTEGFLAGVAVGN